jgi:hypothetical protein
MCAHPKCGSGQLHDSGLSLRRKVICITCKRETCSFHGVVWHAGMTCDQYDQRQKITQDTSSIKWISGNTKQCPQCNRSIQKNGGCNHMRCTSTCRHEFCWECSADYRRIIDIGLHEHRDTCSHYRPRNFAQSTTTSNHDIRSARPNYNTPRTSSNDDTPRINSNNDSLRISSNSDAARTRICTIS